MRKKLLVAKILALGMYLVIVAATIGPLAAHAEEPQLGEEFLKNPENIERGKKVFLQRCTYCHASHGFSGKAPQVHPTERPPDFLLERITKGFMERGMPPWEFVLLEDDRRAIVAFLLSDPNKY